MAMRRFLCHLTEKAIVQADANDWIAGLGGGLNDEGEIVKGI